MGIEFDRSVEHRTPHGWALCVGEPAGPDGRPRPIDLGLADRRIYGLYSFLSGTRPRRGLPPDLSAAGRELTVGVTGEVWGVGHTWLTLRELLEAGWPEWLRRELVYSGALSVLRGWGGVDDVRLGFWNY